MSASLNMYQNRIKCIRNRCSRLLKFNRHLSDHRILNKQVMCNILCCRFNQLSSVALRPFHNSQANFPVIDGCLKIIADTCCSCIQFHLYCNIELLSQSFLFFINTMMGIYFQSTYTYLIQNAGPLSTFEKHLLIPYLYCAFIIASAIRTAR